MALHLHEPVDVLSMAACGWVSMELRGDSVHTKVALQPGLAMA